MKLPRLDRTARRWSAAVVAGLLAGCAPAADVPWGLALEGNPVTVEQIARESAASGLTPARIAFFLTWPEDPGADNFPRAGLDAIAAAGAEPVVTWEPMFYTAGGQEVMVSIEQLRTGVYDRYIDAFAREAAAWSRPLIIRLAHEMNLARYHWGTGAAAYGPDSPAIYRELWRHIVGRFRAAGAQNVRWAFCPNAESIPNPSFAPGTEWNTLSAYYPGDDWVDVLGLDGYNWGTTQVPEQHGWRSHWRSFAEVFGSARDELRALASDKPLIIFETASAAAGGDKARWIAEAQATAQAWQLAGVIWFQVDKEVDWRLQALR